MRRSSPFSWADHLWRVLRISFELFAQPSHCKQSGESFSAIEIIKFWAFSCFYKKDVFSFFFIHLPRKFGLSSFFITCRVKYFSDDSKLNYICIVSKIWCIYDAVAEDHEVFLDSFNYSPFFLFAENKRKNCHFLLKSVKISL